MLPPGTGRLPRVLPERRQMATETVRQRFQVEYRRQGKTNRWFARTKRKADLEGATAVGAVAYVTDRKEVVADSDESRALVTVLTPSLFRSHDATSIPHPELRLIVEQVVRELADARFKAVHPEAVV